jgi:hypothetical protein
VLLNFKRSPPNSRLHETPGDSQPRRICETNMTITEIITRHDEAEPCLLRDIAEPVEFTLSGRFRIVISRFADAETITAERLNSIITLALQSEGITVVQ